MRASPLAMAAALASLAALAGCGGGFPSQDDGGSPSAQTTTTAKRRPARPRRPEGFRTVSSRLDGTVTARRLSYRTWDGERVSALLAIPRATAPRGCLIYETGFRTRKEDAAAAWPVAARLGLATFSIDLRDQGERAGAPGALGRVRRSPERIRDLVVGTERDLRRAVDLLARLPLCRRTIAFAGESLGGIIGTVLAARDRRVRAAALLSVPASWTALIDATDVLLPGIDRSPGQRRAALRVLAPLDPARWVGRIAPRPVLLLYGSRDPIIPRRSRAAMIAAARPPVSFRVYRGGHLPFEGRPAGPNTERVSLFLLDRVVRPTYRGS